MTLDTKSEAFIGNAQTHLESLLSFAPTAFGGIEPAALFWHRDGCATPRITFLGPSGTQIPEILGLLSDISLREADLRDSIYEAVESAVERRLFDDGTLAEDKGAHSGNTVLQVHGNRWLGAKISGGLLNVGMPDGSLNPDRWIDRVSITIIVTSARALLGVAESNLIRRLKKEQRFFVLLVTGVEGDNNQIEEIKNELETYRIKPFMEELGQFSVVYYHSELPWIDELSAIVKREIGKSHCLQLVFVVQRWLDEWSSYLEQLWLDDQKKRSQVNDIRMHLANMTARLSDIARRITTDLSLNITDLYSALENTADKTAAHFIANINEQLETMESLVLPMKKAWTMLDEAVKRAPHELIENLDLEWKKEIVSFSETYRSILLPQQIDIPAINRKSFDSALELWEQISLEKFSTHIIKSLEEIQAKHQDKTDNKASETVSGVATKNKWLELKDILQKVQSKSSSTDKLEHEVSSLITEGLRRYVRDRMSKITQAIEEDSNVWIPKDLRDSLEAWRLTINVQLDEQLSSLKAEEYKGKLLNHRDVWRNLSLQIHSEL